MNPIRVVDPDPSWPDAFAAEKLRLETRLGGLRPEIHHVGSTSVPGLAAKPKIDIDAVLRGERQLAEAVVLMGRDLSWTCHGDPRGDGMWTFTAPRGGHGIRLYLCRPGNRKHLDRLLFRDWLRRNRRDADEYAALKRRLALEAAGDFKAYTDGKSDFVARIVALAAGPLETAGALIPPASTSAR